VLEAYVGEICADYEKRLRAMDSPLVRDDKVREQLATQARSIIEDTVGVLRGQEPRTRHGEDLLSETIGASRAMDNVHPSESFRAVKALSAAALNAVAEKLPPSTSSRTQVAAVALAIQESIMDRVTNASVAYGAYLLRKAHESSVDERRRIGRELHDRLAPTILAIHHSVEVYATLESGESEKAKTKVRLAGSKAREALLLIKELSTELRSSEAREGLEVAISDFLRMSVPQNIRSWVSIEGDESVIEPYVRDELFLIIREAIRNAVAHSEALNIRVGICTTVENVTVTVEDDGRGFETDTAARTGGTGLGSMEERALLLGGSLYLSSKPERGTKVTIRVPLPGRRRR
jgi:signal transduction histidine kinase